MPSQQDGRLAGAASVVTNSNLGTRPENARGGCIRMSILLGKPFDLMLLRNKHTQPYLHL